MGPIIFLICTFVATIVAELHQGTGPRLNVLTYLLDVLAGCFVVQYFGFDKMFGLFLGVFVIVLASAFAFVIDVIRRG